MDKDADSSDRCRSKPTSSMLSQSTQHQPSQQTRSFGLLSVLCYRWQAQRCMPRWVLAGGTRCSALLPWLCFRFRGSFGSTGSGYGRARGFGCNFEWLSNGYSFVVILRFLHCHGVRYTKIDFVEGFRDSIYRDWGGMSGIFSFFWTNMFEATGAL